MNRAIIALILLLAVPCAAHSQSRQIRMDENTCENILPEYTRKKNSSTYAKALAAQKAGKAREKHRAAIHEVEFLRSALKHAKCKGVK